MRDFKQQAYDQYDHCKRNPPKQGGPLPAILGTVVFLVMLGLCFLTA